MHNPCLTIYPKRIKKNAQVLRQACLQAGVEPVAVIKGFNAHPLITDALVAAGYSCLCSSRLPHLFAMKQRYPDIKTMALRVPMLSELPELLQVADISLVSEPAVLREMNKLAGELGRRHQVILMRDLGDLREGQIHRETFYVLAELAERLPNLDLLGIGCNLSCYGSVVPTKENLGELAADAKEIQRCIGRKLDVVSGGSTSSLPLVIHGGMPEGINQLRLGEALLVPYDLTGYWESPLEGLSNCCLLLDAEIIEIGEKPTMPQGKLARNAFGAEPHYEDRGWRKRALLALGVADIGDESKLVPEDPGVTVLGASSDHLIVDIQDSAEHYQLGDVIRFQLRYKTMLFATATEEIATQVSEEN